MGANDLYGRNLNIVGADSKTVISPVGYFHLLNQDTNRIICIND